MIGSDGLSDHWRMAHTHVDFRTPLDHLIAKSMEAMWLFHSRFYLFVFNFDKTISYYLTLHPTPPPFFFPEKKIYLLVLLMCVFFHGLIHLASNCQLSCMFFFHRFLSPTRLLKQNILLAMDLIDANEAIVIFGYFVFTNLLYFYSSLNFDRIPFFFIFFLLLVFETNKIINKMKEHRGIDFIEWPAVFEGLISNI